MAHSTTLHVLRVFTAPDGGGGNPLGVFLDGASVPAPARQQVAADLAFSETVFVDRAGSVAIFTPAVELPFAGHPLVGTAWLLGEQGHPVTLLRPPAGDVPVRVEGERTWIRGRAEWAPEMQLQELDTPTAVDALGGPPDGVGFFDAWSWIDQEAGIVRCRVFAPAVGIPEDEATGAAAVRLVSALERPITIRQGRGSVISARPGPEGTAEIGGTCVVDEVRRYVLP